MGKRGPGSAWSWSSLVAEHGIEGAFDALMDQTGLGSYASTYSTAPRAVGPNEQHIPLEQGDIVHDEAPSPGVSLRDVLLALDTEHERTGDYPVAWWSDEYVGDQRPWAAGKRADNMPLERLSAYGQRGGQSRWHPDDLAPRTRGYSDS